MELHRAIMLARMVDGSGVSQQSTSFGREDGLFGT